MIRAFVCPDRRGKTAQTGRLKQKFIFSQLEALDQSVSGLILSEASLCALQMAVFSLRPYVIFPLCSHISGVSLCVLISSSFKDASKIELGSNVTHYNLNTPVKILSPSTVTF